MLSEQEASTIQRDKQKEMNIREKILFWEKKLRNFVPIQFVAEQQQTPAPLESCGGVRSGSPTLGQETWRV